MWFDCSWVPSLLPTSGPLVQPLEMSKDAEATLIKKTKKSKLKDKKVVDVEPPATPDDIGK